MTATRATTPRFGAVMALAENHRRFLAFLEPRVGDRETAEDILQAAFVRGLERADDLRDQDRAVAWFYRILRRAVVDHWRSRAAERRGTEAVVRELQYAEEPAPELAGELCKCFEPLLGTLKPEYEEILRRVDLEEVRPVDFAAETGITANNAMVRLHRARRALREQMSLSCRTCAEHGCFDCSCNAPSEQATEPATRAEAAPPGTSARPGGWPPSRAVRGPRDCRQPGRRVRRRGPGGPDEPRPNRAHPGAAADAEPAASERHRDY